jgi:hypothetical protein
MNQVVAAAFAALAASLLAGCPNTPRSGQLATPTFNTLEIPMPAGGGWTTYSTSSPPAEVLPTRGRELRLYFYAPIGSTFGVSLREPDGTLTALTDSRGAPVPPEAGYFQIFNVNPGQTPPSYRMSVRAPLSLMDQGNYDILVVNKSLRSDVTDSNPMVVPLRQRKVFTVTVQVVGGGHVTSTPPGIECGTSSSGAAMTACSHEFGAGPVSLNPGTNNLNTTRFKQWAGNCTANVQVCGFTLDGMGPVAATAIFEARANPVVQSSCPVAPLLPGLKWAALPGCASNDLAGKPSMSRPALCDAAGYFCCDGSPTTRGSANCGTTPDCNNDIRKTLRQPGGCYEVNSFP